MSHPQHILTGARGGNPMNPFRATASQLAGRAGMPSTKRGVLCRARSEGWPYTEEKGLGGTHRVFFIERLPSGVWRGPDVKAKPHFKLLLDGRVTRLDANLLRGRLNLSQWPQRAQS